MSKAGFTIAYDGTAIADSSMDVRDLAPALLAVGTLFNAANRTLNGASAPKIPVNVVATAPGSFEIVLDVIQSFYEQAKSLLVGEEVTAALNITNLIFLGGAAGGSLVVLIRTLRGRKPDRVEKISPDTVRLSEAEKRRKVRAIKASLLEIMPAPDHSPAATTSGDRLVSPSEGDAGRRGRPPPSDRHRNGNQPGSRKGGGPVPANWKMRVE